MVDALSNDDAAKIFKHFISVHDIKNAIQFAILQKLQGCPVLIYHSSVM